MMEKPDLEPASNLMKRIGRFWLEYWIARYGAEGRWTALKMAWAAF
jgi:hypothetical protein